MHRADAESGCKWRTPLAVKYSMLSHCIHFQHPPYASASLKWGVWGVTPMRLGAYTLLAIYCIMEKYIIHSGIISFIYLLMKFVEMRITKNEAKPMKELIRDTVIVYLSAIIGLYIIGEFMPTTNVVKTVTNVFTDIPSF